MVWYGVGKVLLGGSLLLDNAGYVLRKLAHTRATKLENHPTTGQMLFLRVSYPLRLVLVPVDC